jgi:hypothetical protein
LTEITVERTPFTDCAVIKRNLREKTILKTVIGMKLQDVIMGVRNKEVQMCKVMRLEGLYRVIGRRKLGRLGYCKINNLRLNLKFNKSLIFP